MMSDLPGLILLSLRFLLVICLYVFLARALWILWKNLQIDNTPKQTVTPINITISAGEEPPKTHLLTNPVYLLGRAASCDISLPNETVSGLHARIYYESANWWVEDLGSSNGTLLNESYLEQPTVLTDSDQLQFGNVNAAVEFLPSGSDRPNQNKGTK